MSGLQLFGTITLFSTLGLLIVCFILYAILHRKRHYQCPNCGKRFKTSAASTFFAARDGVDKRMVCPYCGHFGYMQDHRDDEPAAAQSEDIHEDAAEGAQGDDPIPPNDKA